MKAFVRVAGVLVFLGIFGNLAFGDSDLDDLRKEISNMRAEYETKIAYLQSEIDSLAGKVKEETPQPSKTEPISLEKKKLLDIEYVGRYEGPFKKGGLLIKNPSGFGNVSVGGYADIEFESFEKNVSAFDQHRFVINRGAELFDRLRFYSEYEIEHGGPDASGGGEAKVEQAWMDFLIADWINLRAGALLVPFGRYNLYHDSDLQDLTDRPLVDRRIIPTTWTEAGAGFHGEFNPVIGSYEDLIIGYEAYVINGLDAGFSDSGLRGARGSLSSDNNQFKSIVSRVLVSPFLGHEFGFSGYYGEYDKSGHYITGGAIDWFDSFKIPLDIKGLSVGPLELVGEAAFFRIDEFADGNVPEFMSGFYAQTNLHFWPEILNKTFLGKFFDDPAFTLVGRYDWIKIDDDPDMTLGPNEESRFTIGLNYRPVESCVFKVEYQFNNTTNETLERGNNNGIIASAAIGF